MQLFFDSGATKCDSILLNDEGQYVQHYTTQGINLSYTDDSTIETILQQVIAVIPRADYAITFAGAGGGKPDNQQRMEAILKNHFPHSAIEVISDLLGACRVMSHGESAMVAILGTGSSVCLFDGAKITAQAPSLGYLLGDEGSGTYLGMKLITKYLRHELPEEIAHVLATEYHLTHAEAIRRIYRESKPNLFFSQFAPFLAAQQTHPAIHQLLYDALSDFFKVQVCSLPRYDHHTLHVMGSIAYHFQDILGEVCKSYGIRLGKIAASPLAIFKRMQ